MKVLETTMASEGLSNGKVTCEVVVGELERSKQK